MKKLVIVAIILVLLSTSVGIALAKDNLSGTISMSGAWALYPLAVKWGEAFKQVHPNVKLDISAGGAGKGMTDVLAGAVDLGMVSREIDKAEKAKGAVPIFVAKDGVFLTVNANNPALKAILAHGLSKEKLVDIFITGKIKTWKDAVPGGPDLPIHVYTRSDSCGAASAWAATLGKYKQENLRGTGVNSDPGLLDQVKKDRAGIGYNNLSFLFVKGKVMPGVCIVPLDMKGNGQLTPGDKIDSEKKAFDEISAGRYPGARKEYLVAKGSVKGLAAEFVKFALSDSGTKVLLNTGGFVPLTRQERIAQLALVK